MITRIIDYIYTFYLMLFVGHIGWRAVIEYPVKLTNPSKIWIGSRARIGRYSWLNCSSESAETISLRIGVGAAIGRNCHINAWRDVIIEDYALLSNNVHVSDVSHTFSDPSIPIILQPAEFQGAVRIGFGSWIGYGAVILPNVSIGQNCVVGALSLVNRNAASATTVAGIPARPIVRKG